MKDSATLITSSDQKPKHITEDTENIPRQGTFGSEISDSENLQFFIPSV
jgi:hypothetical protein